MKSLLGRLFTREPRRFTVFETILWWERRRVPYNLLVGAAGVISTASAVLTAVFTKSACGLPDPPLSALFSIVTYAIAANVLYTGGWIAELVLRRRIETNEFARWGFIFGTLFSIVITLAPTLTVPVGCALFGSGAQG
ncbi:MAG: hypothetical protein ACRES7_07790 [Gammaproteobacteria bacterium]